MKRFFRYAPVVFTAAWFAAATAQPPTSAPGNAMPPTTHGQRPPEKPKNLKVLPADTNIRAVMHQYEADLGVHCSFCHVGPDPATHRTDFASDENATKNAARFMIQMTADLNAKYLPQMPMRSFGDTITCGTCHRGHYRPPVVTAPPESEGNHPPAAAMPAQAAPNASAPTASSR